MRVLFLALGATRRRGVVEESAHVVATGGTAIVLVEAAKSWQRETFAPGVTMVELSRLAMRHPPMWLERLLLYRGPRFLLYRVIGRGPLRPATRRVAKAYERRIADRVHRRLFMPAYRRIWRDVRPRLVERHVLRGTDLQTLVVADPLSMPEADRILRGFTVRHQALPIVCYSIDHVVREVSAARVG